MGTRRASLWAGAVSLVAGLLAPAFASATFAPTIKFSPSTRTAGANPEMNVRIAQAPGEEPTEKPGDYTLESIFSSTEGSIHVVKQKIKITK